jgi:hypothetical protein
MLLEVLVVFATLIIVVINDNCSPKPGFGTNHLLLKPKQILHRLRPIQNRPGSGFANVTPKRELCR